MTIMESAIAMNDEYVSCTSMIDRINLFAEASHKEYQINLKEAALKIMQENGSDEDFEFLAQEAGNTYLDRTKKAIDKIIESVKKFIEKCKYQLTVLVESVKTKLAISKAEEACENNPKLKGLKVKYQDTDKQCNILQQGIDEAKKAIAKIKARGHATPEDTKECERIEKSTAKKVAAVTTVAVVTVTAALMLYKKFGSKSNVTNEFDNFYDDDFEFYGGKDYTPDPQTASTFVRFANLMSKLKKEKMSKTVIGHTSILSGIKSAFSGVKGLVKSKNLEESVSFEDLPMFASIVEESEEYDDDDMEGLNLNDYFNEMCDDIFDESSNAESLLSDIEQHIEESCTDTYMENMERELFSDDEIATESYDDILNDVNDFLDSMDDLI